MIKKLILILFILFITNSCASLLTPEPKVDKELQIYLDAFVSESNGIVKKSDVERISLRFKKYGKNEDKNKKIRVVGTAYILSGHITISEEWWKQALPLEKRVAVYHELGHCVLFRDHTSPTAASGVWGWIEKMLFKTGIWKEKGYLEDGCPISLMHPYITNSFCTMKHYVGYMTELYSGSVLFR